MAFVNNFLVGADPEFVVMEPPAVINAQKLHPTNLRPKEAFFGWDHAGFVVEPHPTPDISVRKVVQNIKRCLDGLSVPFGNQKWRAGAYIAGSNNGLLTGRRNIGLGGHVHLDFPEPSAAQIRAFDSIYATLLNLEILPPAESASRLDITGYGRVSDVRFEHGHMEYRSLCSWLFSRKAAMLSMTAIKLAAVDPRSCAKAFTSKVDFKNWFETFADKDDDAKWIIEKPYFEGDLTARPDRDMKSIWAVDPEKGKELYTEVEAESVTERTLRERQETERILLEGRAALNTLGANRVPPGGMIPTNNPQQAAQQYYNNAANTMGMIQREALEILQQQANRADVIANPHANWGVAENALGRPRITARTTNVQHLQNVLNQIDGDIILYRRRLARDLMTEPTRLRITQALRESITDRESTLRRMADEVAA